jgi:hypothetical protein
MFYLILNQIYSYQIKLKNRYNMWFGQKIFKFKKLINVFNNSSSILLNNNNNKNKLLIINYKKYYISIFLSLQFKLFFLKNLHSYLLTSISLNNLIYLKYILYYYINILFRFFFKKIKFKGKGYYFFKSKKNSLAFQLNYSHKINYKFNNLFIYNFSKTSWLFLSLNSLALIKQLEQIIQLRRFNPFTQKGIRFTNKILYIKKK